MIKKGIIGILGIVIIVVAIGLISNKDVEITKINKEYSNPTVKARNIVFEPQEIIDLKIEQEAKNTYKYTDIYKRLIEDKDASAKFEIANPTAYTPKLDFLFNNRFGQINDLVCIWYEDVEKTIDVYTEERTSKVNATGGTEYTIKRTKTGTTTITVNERRESQFPCYDVKGDVEIIPDIEWVLKPDGKRGYDIEWYPNISLGQETYINYDWANFNASCSLFMEDTLVHHGTGGALSNFPAYLNGTGFDFGNGTQTAWGLGVRINGTNNIEFSCGDDEFYYVNGSQNSRLAIDCDGSPNGICTEHNPTEVYEVRTRTVYHFEDLLDSSSHGINLVANETGVQNFNITDKVFGNASISFNTSDESDKLNATINIPGFRNHSYLVWAFWRDTNGDSTSQRLFKYESVDVQYKSGEGDIFLVSDSGEGRVNLTQEFGATQGKNTWVCWGITQNDTNRMIYSNGTLINLSVAKNINDIPNGGTGVIRLGYLQPTSPQRGFDGLIDEFRAYNRTLSQPEIQAYCDEGFFALSSGSNQISSFGAEEKGSSVIIDSFTRSPTGNVTFNDTLEFNFVANNTGNTTFWMSLNLSAPNGTMIELNRTNFDTTGTINQTYTFNINPTDFGDWVAIARAFNGTNTSEQNITWTILDPPPTPTLFNPLINLSIVGTSFTIVCDNSTNIQGNATNFEIYADTSNPPVTLLSNTTANSTVLSGMNATTHFVRCRANVPSEGNSNFTETIAISAISAFAGSACNVTNSTHALAINITFKNENNESRLFNVNHEARIHLWADDRDINTTLLINEATINETLICISPPDQTIFSDAKFGYVVPTHDLRHFYFRNRTLDNITENLSFFALDISLADQILFDVVDENDIPIEGFFIEILREILGTNTFPVVAMMQTDNNGNDVTFLRKADADYIINVYNYTERVFQSSVTTITENSLTVRITPATAGQLQEKYKSLSNIITRLSNSTTHTITSTFSDPTSETENCRMEIFRSVNATRIRVGTTNLSAASGALVLSFANQTGTYDAVTTCRIDGIEQIIDRFTFTVFGEFDNLPALLGATGAIIAFLFLLTLAVIGAVDPTISIAFMGAGMIALVFMGFWNIAPVYLGGIIVILILAAWRSD